MTIALILALLLGGSGVSYAAENTVPGDALYTIKVNVNEEVRDLIALTPEAKAGWESRLVERRLEEAEKLASEDALNPEAQKTIEERIAKHVEKIEEHVARVEEKKNIADAAEISANLEVTFRAHKEVFEKIAQKQSRARVAHAIADGAVATSTDDGDEGEEGRDAEARLGSFIQKIELRAQKAEELYETHLETTAFEDAPGRAVSAEMQKKNATKHLGALVSLFDAAKDTLAPDMRARIEEGIAKTRAIMTEGDTLFEAKEYGKSFLKFGEARAYAQKIAVFLKSQTNLGVSVDEEEFHPREAKAVRMEAKESSRKEIADKVLRKAGEMLTEVKTLFSANEATISDEIREKVKNAIASSEELITKGKSAFDTGEYGTAYLAGQRAVRTLKDVREMIQDDEGDEGEDADEDNDENEVRGGTTTPWIKARIRDDNDKPIKSSRAAPAPVSVKPTPLETRTTESADTKIAEADDENETKCEYAAPPQDCNYVKSSNYDEETSCGLVLECLSSSASVTGTEGAQND